MMQYFGADGKVYPVTAVSASPVKVKRIFAKEKDGYDSVQLSWSAGKKEKIKEFRLKPGDKNEVKEGDTIDVSVFAPGDMLQVSGVSKGKGFQGVVKRHRFKGGPRTHGQKHSEREAGSIGSTGQQKVSKGRRMAGRMGSDRIAVKGLRVLGVDTTNGKILVSGCVPGVKGALLEIKAQNA